MLKKRERFSRNEYTTLLRVGKRFHTEYFSLVYRTRAEHMKCGVVIGKKVAKRAVKRNLLRRKIFGVLERNKTILEGKHVAVLTKPRIIDLCSSEIENYLTEALQKLS